MRPESRRFVSSADQPGPQPDTDHVVELVAAVGRRIGLAPSDEMARLELAATLHAIGAGEQSHVTVWADEALGEGGEISVARAESIYGAALADRARNAGDPPAPGDTADPGDDLPTVVRAVEERWDGRGHPDGLSGGRIPLASRVIAACEAYDALTSVRPGGGGMTPLEASRELVGRAGSQLDPVVVATLIGHLRRTRVLTIVEPGDEGADEAQRSAAWSASAISE